MGEKVEETWLCLSQSLVQQRFSICCSGQRPHIPGKKASGTQEVYRSSSFLRIEGKCGRLNRDLVHRNTQVIHGFLWTGVLYCPVLLHPQKIAALFTLHSIRRPKVFNTNEETNPYFTSLVCLDWLWLLFELITEGLCPKLCFWPLIVWCCPSFCEMLFQDADSSKKRLHRL